MIPDTQFLYDSNEETKDDMLNKPCVFEHYGYGLTIILFQKI